MFSGSLLAVGSLSVDVYQLVSLSREEASLFFAKKGKNIPAQYLKQIYTLNRAVVFVPAIWLFHMEIQIQKYINI